MGTFSRRLSVKILSFLLAFSLAYAPIALLPQVSPQSVYAQGEGGQNGSGGGSSGGGGATTDVNAGIDSKGNLDSGSFGINGQGQVVDAEGNVVDLSSPGGFLATIFDFALMVFGGPFGIALSLGNLAINVTNGTNTTMGEKVFGGTSLMGDLTRGVTEGLSQVTGLDLSPAGIGAALSGVSEVSFGTNGEMTTTVTDAEGVTHEVTSDFLNQNESTDWGDYIDGINEGIAANPDPNVEPQAVSLSVSESEVEPGGSATLNWTSDAGSTCYTQGYHWAGRREAQGSAVVSNIQQDQVFLIQCTRRMEYSGGGDNSQPTVQEWTGVAYAQVIVRNATSTASTTPNRPQPVQPRPVRTPAESSSAAQGLAISVSGISASGQATLRWSAEDNRSCSFSGPWPGSAAEAAAAVGRDASAVSTLFNVPNPSVFRLSCVGVDGVSRSVSATAAR